MYRHRKRLPRLVGKPFIFSLKKTCQSFVIFVVRINGAAKCNVYIWKFYDLTLLPVEEITEPYRDSIVPTLHLQTQEAKVSSTSIGS